MALFTAQQGGKIERIPLRGVDHVGIKAQLDPAAPRRKGGRRTVLDASLQAERTGGEMILKPETELAFLSPKDARLSCDRVEGDTLFNPVQVHKPTWPAEIVRAKADPVPAARLA